MLHCKAWRLQFVRAEKHCARPCLAHRASYSTEDCRRIPESEHFPSLRTLTIRHLLNDIGFIFEKCKRNSMIIERQVVLTWQQKYLCQVAEYRQQHRKVFYTDKTWVNAGPTVAKAWRGDTVKSTRNAFLRGLTIGLKQPSGKGARLIVTHTGNKDGFVDGCLQRNEVWIPS